MDRRTCEEVVPELVLEAFGQLRVYRIVEITEGLRWEEYKGSTAWSFWCYARIPQPSRENLPAQVLLRVVMPDGFPYVPVEIYSESEEVAGFPHQDAESRKLCLPEERLAPRDPTRLICYVRWALEWLTDAAAGNLLKPGEPYELPDFSRKLLPKGVYPETRPLLFIESAESFGRWQAQIGGSGGVHCAALKKLPAMAAFRFLDAAGRPLWEPPFDPNGLDWGQVVQGVWVLVPDVRYRRHRPPQTFAELDELLHRENLELYRMLHRAWDSHSTVHIGMLLVGFPVPRTVGAPPIEVHWQPLVFPNRAGDTRAGALKARKARAIWEELLRGRFAPDKQLPWCHASNASEERLYARSGLPEAVRCCSIVLLGCGALGSAMAELLVRGGARKLDLFDPDTVQLGNLCRHTLDGSRLGWNKALALAEHLSSVNPSARVRAWCIGAPLASSAPVEARDALTAADLVLDCTCSDSAFEWLIGVAAEHKQRLATLFTDLKAELLTVCISGAETTCRAVFDDLQAEVRQARTAIDPAHYFRQPDKEELILEGAGCWHPTFPARAAHIAVLAAAASDAMILHIAQTGSGLAAVFRRVAVDTLATGLVVECLWQKQYR